MEWLQEDTCQTLCRQVKTQCAYNGSGFYLGTGR